MPVEKKEDSGEGEEKYLIIGKIVNPVREGLDQITDRIGPDEVLVEVPAEIIDNMEE